MATIVAELRRCLMGRSVPIGPRTPETWDTYSVNTIGRRAIGAGTADIDSGVRPAFCIETSTKVIQRDDIVKDQSVYVLGFNEDK